MIASSVRHVATTVLKDWNACIVFLLYVGKTRTRPEVVLSEAVRTGRMRTNTNSCGILTFATLLRLSLVVYQGKHLGENHQKLVIPAGNGLISARAASS